MMKMLQMTMLELMLNTAFLPSSNPVDATLEGFFCHTKTSLQGSKIHSSKL